MKQVRLRSMPLFQGLEDDEISQIASAMTETRVEAGQDVLSWGGSPRFFAIIHEGLAQVLKGDEEVARLSAGSFFGEHSMLHSTAPTATVSALTPLRLLVLDQASFQAILRDIPVLADRIASVDDQRVSENATGASFLRQN